MKNILAALAVALLAGACTMPNDETTRVLKMHGYKNIEVGGITWFSCAEDDHWGRKFKATNHAGLPVEGYVCGRFFGKGSTLRF